MRRCASFTTPTYGYDRVRDFPVPDRIVVHACVIRGSWFYRLGSETSPTERRVVYSVPFVTSPTTLRCQGDR